MRFSALFLALCALFVSPAFGADPLNKIVAVVNGEMITSFDLTNAVGQELAQRGLDPRNPAQAAQVREAERRMLEQMIDDIILAQEAVRLKVAVSESDVDAALQQFKERNRLSNDEFQRQLKIQKVELKDFRDRIRKSLLKNRLLSNMVGRKVVVTKEEIAKYYEEHKDSLQGERRVRVGIIVYPPQAPAENWAQRIKSGQVDFQKAAREISVGPKASEGGDLGEIAWQDLAPALQKRLASLKPGGVSELFRINKLQAQVKLISSKTGAAQTLEEASAQIEDILREPRLEERYREYTTQLRKRAVVDVRL